MWQLGAVIEHMHKQYQRGAYLRQELVSERLPQMTLPLGQMGSVALLLI
jgi:hypothetical protein